MLGLWKLWFGVLAAAGLYGLVLFNDARSKADLNDLLADSAPQQTVAALWGVRDLLGIVVIELIVLVLAVVSMGLKPKAPAGVATTPSFVPSITPDSPDSEIPTDGRHSASDSRLENGPAADN